MVPVWSAARTRLFEHRILRLTASAGFPLSWVENPEFQALREEFIPGSPHISRKVLTKRILQEVVTEFRGAVKQRVAGKEATMQSDGWTGINNHHLVAFMITTNKKVPQTIIIAH
jgi:predicted component of type VI protein secretion system